MKSIRILLLCSVMSFGYPLYAGCWEEETETIKNLYDGVQGGYVKVQAPRFILVNREGKIVDIDYDSEKGILRDYLKNAFLMRKWEGYTLFTVDPTIAQTPAHKKIGTIDISHPPHSQPHFVRLFGKKTLGFFIPKAVKMPPKTGRLLYGTALKNKVIKGIPYLDNKWIIEEIRKHRPEVQAIDIPFEMHIADVKKWDCYVNTTEAAFERWKSKKRAGKKPPRKEVRQQKRAKRQEKRQSKYHG